MYRLLLKIHNITGLKYLCYTKRSDYMSYSGSGVFWKRHIKKHGKDISTIVLYETEIKEDFIKIAKEYSEKLNVEKDKSFANLIIEKGDGGSTTHLYRWINNGIINKFILKTEEIPTGFEKGRLCNFRNKEFQKEMANRANLKIKNDPVLNELVKENCKKMGLGNKDKPNRSIQGEKNPMKNLETRKKVSESLKKLFVNGDRAKHISEMQKNRSKIFTRCEHCGQKVHLIEYGIYHGKKCKKKKSN